MNIKLEYNKYTKNKLFLNSNEISRIQQQIYGKYKGLFISECIDKLGI